MGRAATIGEGGRVEFENGDFVEIIEIDFSRKKVKVFAGSKSPVRISPGGSRDRGNPHDRSSDVARNQTIQ